MICKSCGIGIPNNSLFCNHCGTRIEEYSVTIEQTTEITEDVIEDTSDEVIAPGNNNIIHKEHNYGQDSSNDNKQKKLQFNTPMKRFDNKVQKKILNKKLIPGIIILLIFSLFISRKIKKESPTVAQIKQPEVNSSDYKNNEPTVLIDVKSEPEIEDVPELDVNSSEYRILLSKDVDILISLKQMFIGMENTGGNEFFGREEVVSTEYKKDGKYYIHYLVFNEAGKKFNYYLEPESEIFYTDILSDWVEAEAMVKYKIDILYNLNYKVADLTIEISEPSHVDWIDGKEYIVSWGEVYRGSDYFDYFQLLGDSSSGEIKVWDANHNILDYNQYISKLETNYLTSVAKESPQEVTIGQLNKTMYGYDNYIIFVGRVDWIQEEFGLGNMLVSDGVDLVHIQYFGSTVYLKGDCIVVVAGKPIQKTSDYTRGGVQIDIPSVRVSDIMDIGYYRR